MVIIQLDSEELSTVIQSAVRKALADQTPPPASISDRWFSIEELSEYLPGQPTVTTLYGKVQRREIPFSRQGKRLIFRQSEIDLWLQSGRVKTRVEISSVADLHSTRQRKGGRQAA